MAIIVAGKLKLQSGTRERFVRQSAVSVKLARNEPLCLDFAVSEDSIDKDRVNIYEKWVTREALEAFRSAPPDDDLFSLVESFDVSEYVLPEKEN